MNGFARGLRGIVLSLLPLLSRALSLPLFLSPSPPAPLAVRLFLALTGCQTPSFSEGGLLQTLTQSQRQWKAACESIVLPRNRHRVRRRRRHCRRFSFFPRVSFSEGRQRQLRNGKNTAGTRRRNWIPRDTKIHPRIFTVALGRTIRRGNNKRRIDI